MIRLVSSVLIAVFAAVAPAQAQQGDGSSQEAVEVMIVGFYHFANPGLDAVNMEIDDVLAEQRQREIQILTDSLAEWQPTKIAVENRAAAPDFVMPDFADTAELLKTVRNESVQVGYRLAAQLGHDAVYGFDEQPSDGEPDYFPMEPMMEFAQANGQAQTVTDSLARVQAEIGAEQAKLAERSIAESLLFHNRRAEVRARHDRLYYAFLEIGDGDAQPGANLNAMWYLRNAKMFAKLGMIAEPGDRILAVVGSGHAAWLQDFVERTPGYELADAYPYVLAASIASDRAERE